MIFANKTHLNPNREEIHWTREDLHRPMLKRATSASERLRDLFLRLRLLDEGKMVTPTGLEIPTDPERIRHMIHALFGERNPPSPAHSPKSPRPESTN